MLCHCEQNKYQNCHNITGLLYILLSEKVYSRWALVAFPVVHIANAISSTEGQLSLADLSSIDLYLYRPFPLKTLTVIGTMLEK